MTSLSIADVSGSVGGSIQIGNRPGHTLVTLGSGRIANEAVGELEDRLMDLLRDGQTRVVVEFESGATIALDALGMLGRISKRFVDMGGVLVVVGLDRAEKKALRAVEPDSKLAMASGLRSAARIANGRVIRIGRRNAGRAA